MYLYIYSLHVHVSVHWRIQWGGGSGAPSFRFTQNRNNVMKRGNKIRKGRKKERNSYITYIFVWLFMCLHASLHINMNFINKHEYFPRSFTSTLPPPSSCFCLFILPLKKNLDSRLLCILILHEKILWDTCTPYFILKQNWKAHTGVTIPMPWRKGWGGVKVTLISCPNY